MPLKWYDSLNVGATSDAVIGIDTDGTPTIIDSASSYLSINNEGTLTLNGNATVWEDLRVPVTATKVGAARQPGFAQIKDDGSGSTGVYAYHFDKSTEEELFFAVQMPHSWKEGSSISPHVHWCPVSTGGGNVVWGLEYTWASINGTFGDTTIITVTDAAGTTAHKHLMGVFDSITATGQTFSSMLICRLFRKAGDDADTLDADAALLEFDFHYEANRLGTDTLPTG